MYSIYLASCTDEFNLFNDEVKLTANYDETAVVYANICPQNDTNYLRINRGFAVNNFYTAYSNPDSIYFNSNDIQEYAHKLRGEDTLYTYICHDTLIPKDFGGDFPTGKVLLYYFNSTDLLNNSDLDIEFGFTIKTSTKDVTSRTYLIRAATPVNPDLDYLNFRHSIFRYDVLSFKRTQKIQVRGICSFYEKRIINNEYDTVKLTFVFPVGLNTYNEPIATDYYTHSFVISIGTLTYYLEKAIKNGGDLINTTKRWLGKIQFEILCGNTDLVLFESFNNSLTTGFSEELTTYSNIINGVGYLTSYSKSYSKKMKFTRKSSDSIAMRMNEYYFE